MWAAQVTHLTLQLGLATSLTDFNCDHAVYSAHMYILEQGAE